MPYAVGKGRGAGGGVIFDGDFLFPAIIIFRAVDSLRVMKQTSSKLCHRSLAVLARGSTKYQTSSREATWR